MFFSKSICFPSSTISPFLNTTILSAIRDTLSILSDEDKEEYLAELRGEDTIKSLKKRLDELLYKTDVYEKVLQRHNLIEEAKTLMEEGHALSRAFDEWAEAEMGKLPEGELSWLK